MAEDRQPAPALGVEELEGTVATISSLSDEVMEAGYYLIGEDLNQVPYNPHALPEPQDGDAEISAFYGNKEIKTNRLGSFRGSVEGAADEVAVSLEGQSGYFSVPVVDGEFNFHMSLIKGGSANPPSGKQAIRVVPMLDDNPAGAELTQALTFVDPVSPYIPNGNLASSDLEVTLHWTTYNWVTGAPPAEPGGADVDLHLWEPDGAGGVNELYFGTPDGATLGTFVQDCNSFCKSTTQECYEYISYDGAVPVQGEYTVMVDYWSICDTGPLDMTEAIVQIDMGGGAANGGLTRYCSTALFPANEWQGPRPISGCNFNYCDLTTAACCEAADCAFQDDACENIADVPPPGRLHESVVPRGRLR